MDGGNSTLDETPARERDEVIAKIVAFLASIGIDIAEGSVGETTFLPGVEIVAGGLVFDRERLLFPGDLLHDAGHIAVCDGAARANMSGNVLKDQPERNGEEIVALLWSYAASLAANIAPEIVFHEHGYKGERDWILGNFKSGHYVGLPLLAWMGLAKRPGEIDGFPRMLKWLRD